MLPTEEGTGLLPWSWAVERLARDPRLLDGDHTLRWTAERDTGVGRVARRRAVVQQQQQQRCVVTELAQPGRALIESDFIGSPTRWRFRG